MDEPPAETCVNDARTCRVAGDLPSLEARRRDGARLWRVVDIVVAPSSPATSTGAFTTSESERQRSIYGQDAAALVGEIVAEERVTVLMRDTTGSFVVRRRFPSARS